MSGTLRSPISRKRDAFETLFKATRDLAAHFGVGSSVQGWGEIKLMGLYGELKVV